MGPTMPEEATYTASDALASFLRFADQMKEIRDNYERPIWAQTCPCGGSVEVDRALPPSERKRVAANWYGMHARCTRKGGEDA